MKFLTKSFILTLTIICSTIALNSAEFNIKNTSGKTLKASLSPIEMDQNFLPFELSSGEEIDANTDLYNGITITQIK